MANQKPESDKQREQRFANEKVEREQRRANEQEQRDERRRKEESSRNTRPVSSGPTKRQEAKSAAKEYDIDTKGLSTREINRVVSEQKEVEDDMIKFIEKTLDKFTAKKGDDVAPMDAPAAVTSRSTEVSAPPLPSVGSNNYQRPYNPEIILHPFTLLIDDNNKFSLSKNSSIINGINGLPFSLKIKETDSYISLSNRFIVAEAEITEDFKIKDDEFYIKTVKGVENFDLETQVYTYPDTEQVVVDLEKGIQTKLRLFIGEIQFNGSSATVYQAVNTAFRTAVAFHNGIPVYILEPAPSHQTTTLY